MLKSFICLSLICFVATGCVEKPSDPALTNYKLAKNEKSGKYQFIDSKGEPILIVSGQKITSDEILNEPTNLRSTFIIPSEDFKIFAQEMDFDQFKAQIRDYLLIIVENKISYVLLQKSAEKQFGDQLEASIEKAADTEIRRFYQQFGGDQAKADEAIKNKWKTRENYKKQLERDILTQWYISAHQTSDSFISYRELKKKYDSMKDENFAITPMIEFQLIDIIPDRLEITDPNTDRKKYAEEITNEISAKLKSGEDFNDLAKQYSQGHRKEFGGQWDPLNPDSLASPYDSIAKVAKDMKIGEISPPIKAGSHIFIFKLEDKREGGYEPFEKVQNQVKQALLSEQKESEALNKLNDSLMHQMELDETNAFIDFCLEKIYKISNQEKK